MQVGLLEGEYSNRMSVLTIEKNLPDFLSAGKNTFNKRFTGVPAVLEPYEKLSAVSAIFCSFDIIVDVNNENDGKGQNATLQYDLYIRQSNKSVLIGRQISGKCLPDNYRIHVSVHSLTKADLSAFTSYIFVFSIGSMGFMALVMATSYCERGKYNRILTVLEEMENN